MIASVNRNVYTAFSCWSNSCDFRQLTCFLTGPFLPDVDFPPCVFFYFEPLPNSVSIWVTKLSSTPESILRNYRVFWPCFLWNWRPSRWKVLNYFELSPLRHFSTNKKRVKSHATYYLTCNFDIWVTGFQT